MRKVCPVPHAHADRVAEYPQEEHIPGQVHDVEVDKDVADQAEGRISGQHERRDVPYMVRKLGEFKPVADEQQQEDKQVPNGPSSDENFHAVGNEEHDRFPFCGAPWPRAGCLVSEYHVQRESQSFSE